MSVQTGDTPPGPPASVISGESVQDTHIAGLYSRVMATFPVPEDHGLMPDDGCDPDMDVLRWNADRVGQCMALMLNVRLEIIREIDQYVHGNTPYFKAVSDWVRCIDTLSSKLLEELEPSDTATSLTRS